MSSIKQLIVNAIIKVSCDSPPLEGEGSPSAIEARDDFIRLLLIELFPEDPSVPVAVPKKTKKTKDVPAKKTTSVVVKKVEVVPEVLPEAVAQESPGKKKRSPLSDEAKAAMKAKRAATMAAKKAVSPALPESVVDASTAAVPESVPVLASPVKEKKEKKEKKAKEGNLPKIDATWRKHLRNADKEHGKEHETVLVTYLNGLSKEDFNAKKAEEHVLDFLRTLVVPVVPVTVATVDIPKEDDRVEADLETVEFEGKEYFVNSETKIVYEGEGEFEEETGWTNYKRVGCVGMAAFAEMAL